MKDQLLKALVLDNKVRLYIARTTDLVQEARDRFDLHSCATAALGRTLSVGSLMGSMLKSNQEMLSITINGHGPIGTIIVDAYHDGHVRGFCSDPHVEDIYHENGKLNVGAVVGKDGTLTVTKDLHMQDNFVGTVELQSGEIGDDFAYYFTLSEQTPTAVSVGVLVTPEGQVISAGAMIIQMLPDATETEIAYCEHILSGLKPMSTLIYEYDDSSLEELARDLFEDPNILTVQDICFDCPCSKERMANALSTLSTDDLMDIIEQDHGCEITCNFCNERYQFSESELIAILERRNVH
ncbi:MAG: Hsp33 family molecular chaperone HslO [Holdemanella sp.]|nr:Hsp33 family molecular chaperone HslO [Holdemanella sp.]